MIDADRDPWLDEPLTDEERASIAVTGPLYDLDTLEPVGRATPHGIAAALKAEAPEQTHEWFAAYEQELIKRAARKIANARKAKRGWR